MGFNCRAGSNLALRGNARMFNLELSRILTVIATMHFSITGAWAVELSSEMFLMRSKAVWTNWLEEQDQLQLPSRMKKGRLHCYSTVCISDLWLKCWPQRYLRLHRMPLESSPFDSFFPADLSHPNRIATFIVKKSVVQWKSTEVPSTCLFACSACRRWLKDWALKWNCC